MSRACSAVRHGMAAARVAAPVGPTEFALRRRKGRERRVHLHAGLGTWGVWLLRGTAVRNRNVVRSGGMVRVEVPCGACRGALRGKDVCVCLGVLGRG